MGKSQRSVGRNVTDAETIGQGLAVIAQLIADLERDVTALMWPETHHPDPRKVAQYTFDDVAWVIAKAAGENLYQVEGDLSVLERERRDVAGLPKRELAAHWTSPKTVEACTMRSGHARNAQEVRSGVQGGCGPHRPGDG